MEIKNKHYIIGLLFIGFMVRFLAFQSGFMFTNDVNLFQHWGQMAFQHGLGQVYNYDVFGFIDYPPLYIYVLYTLGALAYRFDWQRLSTVFNFFTFLPAILADMGIGYIIYRVVAYGRLTKDKGEKRLDDIPISTVIRALKFSALWILNPAIILISSVWGQVESVFVIFVLISLLLLREKKLIASYILFGIAILIKAQSLFLGPVYLYSAYAFLQNSKVKSKLGGYKIPSEAWQRLFIAIGSAVVLMFILVLPFIHGINIRPIVQLYTGVVGTHPWVSVNAFNFWALMGRNFTHMDGSFLGISHGAWGIFIVLAIVIGSLYALHRDRVRYEGRHFFFIVGALFSLIFIFSVRMHERYLFPAILFFLLYYAETKQRRAFGLFAGLSVTFFFNCTEVLRWLRDIQEYGWRLDAIESSTPLLSAANLAMGILIFYFLIRSYWMSAPTLTEIEAENEQQVLLTTDLEEEQQIMDTPTQTKPQKVRQALPPPPPKLEVPPPMTRKDWAFLFILIVVYSFIAFFRLGDFRAPVTSWTPAQYESAVIDFGETRTVTEFWYRMGPSPVHHEGTEFILEYSNDGVIWNHILQHAARFTDVFNWSDINIFFEGRYFRITANTINMRIQELAFRGFGSELIPIFGVSPGAEALVDEQHLVPEYRNFMNSSIFDEVYHPRSGYEYLHGINVFETTHPPMGKNFKALSMAVFGPTPFGWRFPGTLTGVLMIPLLYAFARLLFKSNNWGLFAAIVFTFDFMHFAQTRLATIDSYVTLFIIAMYFFMYRFIHGIERDSFKKKLVILTLCGVSVGLAAASKWQGIYAILGLPVVFFPALYRLYVIDRKQAEKIFYSCFGFFIVIPLLIYILSYIPFVNATGGGGLGNIWANNVSMFNYHSGLVDTHSFSSTWNEWPFNLRPIWLYAGRMVDGVRGSIASFGNPAVWWAGIGATVYMIWYFFTRFTPGEFIEHMQKPSFSRRSIVTLSKFDRDIAFLLVAYAAQYMPWMLITRLTWIYHYFPSVPFVVLIVTWVFKQAIDRRPSWRPWAIGYACLAIVLFGLFYPVLSGLPMNVEFVQRYLQWLPRWHF
ncbi:MAG: phospholipid carrier-dependent glycosyltransferase [Defluviitaleaceae bacterium]|nr:phospholipid carrier-dependent glycosyltransferase [Defluviitaleaceae bacterium]